MTSNKKPIKLTLFHAEGCGHCTTFKPTWNEMRQDKEANKNIEFEEYEAHELDSLSEKEKTINGEPIEGYPTIKITMKGGEYNYVGKRNTDDIYEFILQRLKQNKNTRSEKNSHYKTKQINTQNDSDSSVGGAKYITLQRILNDNDFKQINQKKLV